MIIQRAKRFHLNGINALIAQYRMSPLKPEYLNHRDIGVVAVDDSGKVVGFTWLGLMAGNKMAFSDYSLVDPTHAKSGIAVGMFKFGIEKLKKVGCDLIVASCRRDDHHDRLIASAQKIGMVFDSVPYTAMYGSVTECSKILGVT